VYGDVQEILKVLLWYAVLGIAATRGTQVFILQAATLHCRSEAKSPTPQDDKARGGGDNARFEKVGYFFVC